MHEIRRIALSAALVLPLSACSFSASIGGGLDIDELENQIVTIGEEQRADLAPWTASCPDAPEELASGASFFCTATDADGLEYEVTVTATDDDGNVNISF